MGDRETAATDAPTEAEETDEFRRDAHVSKRETVQDARRAK